MPRVPKVAKVGDKAQKAWEEFKESWEMIVEIEKEGLKLTEVKAAKNQDLIMEKIHQVEALVKKRNSALKRYLRLSKQEKK